MLMKKYKHKNIFLFGSYLKLSVVLLVAFIFSAINLIGQTNNCQLNLKGIVIDSSNLLPLNHCNIEIINSKNATYTNKNGEFELKNVCQGDIELHVSHLQCEHLHLKLQIFKDTFIKIYIQHSDFELKGAKISVEAKKDFSEINKKQLDNMKGFSISEMMTEISGVQLLRNGMNVSKPIVNGLHSNRVIIINNDIRQEGQNWGLDHAPEIDGNLANEIQLIKGADAIRYASDGIGGVLIVKPHSIFKLKENQLNGERTYLIARNGRGGMTSGSIGNKISNIFPLYWRLQGTLAESGNFKTPQYFLDNTGKIETNYSINLGYQFKRITTEVFYSHFKNKIGIFSGAHIGNLTDLQNAINSSRPLIESNFSYKINRPHQWVSHDLVKIKNEYIINSKNSFELILSYQENNRKEYDILRSGNSSKNPSFDYYIKTTMADVLWTRSDFHRLNFKLGGFLLHQSNAFSGRFVIPGFIQNGGASYFIASTQKNQYKLEGGVRYDLKLLESFLWNQGNLTIDKRTFHHATYHLQMNKYLTAHSEINIVHNSSWRPPAPNELFSNGLHQGLASIEIGKQNLVPERSFNNALTYKLRHHKIYSEVEVFYKYILNFINLVPDNEPVLTIRGAYPVFRFEQHDAEIFGINYIIKYQLSKQFFVQNNSNIALGNNINNKLPLNQFAPITSKLSLGFQNKKLSFVPNLQYTFTQFRYTPNTDLLAPPKGFFIIGAQFNYEFKFKKQSILFNLTLTNMSNQTYREYLNRLRYFADEAGYNIIAKIIIPLNINLKKIPK
jgi:iron complex outermembrane recepter protein